jgi:predicted component of type VI protein secretion system
MKENKRTQRTPEEIIAETENRLDRLLLRQAKQQSKTDPEVAAMYAHRDEVLKAQREAKKILGPSPQGGDARIAKHELWITKIVQEMEEATDNLAGCEAMITQLDADISKRIQFIMNTPKENSQGA